VLTEITYSAPSFPQPRILEQRNLKVLDGVGLSLILLVGCCCDFLHSLVIGLSGELGEAERRGGGKGDRFGEGEAEF
jgi:hypothetical protein